MLNTNIDQSTKKKSYKNYEYHSQHLIMTIKLIHIVPAVVNKSKILKVKVNTDLTFQPRTFLSTIKTSNLIFKKIIITKKVFNCSPYLTPHSTFEFKMFLIQNLNLLFFSCCCVVPCAVLNSK